MLIDTGWDDPTAWDTPVAGLTSLGVAAGAVHGVLITHHHPDHHGLSSRVREESGAWTAMHAADAAIVRRTRASAPGSWLDHLTAKLAAAGAPEEHLAPLRAARATGRMRIPHRSRSIAVSEAEAHLRRPVKLGRAEAVTGSDPVTYIAL